MVRLSLQGLAVAGLAAQRASAALPAIDWQDNKSIAAAAKLVAQDMLSFYPPYNGVLGWTIGILPGPPPDGDYYWWQGGAMWGTLLDYRHYTGDTSFDKFITEAMTAQVGNNKDYNPRNWSASMGNDDQAFWGMSAMIAAETGYTDPPKDQAQWLALVQAINYEQTNLERRAPDDGTPCSWGLRWQVYQTNNGWDYINTISNACYMNMAARLGRYYGNTTYLAQAERTYDFMKKLGYINGQYDVFDGAHLPRCDDINKFQFSYNSALLIQSTAFMYNATNGDAKWKAELDSLIKRTIEVFFGDKGIAFELNCEAAKCTTDMESFKGYLHRWMAYAMQLAPYTRQTIMPVLQSSVKAAVKTCTGGANGRMCGFRWSSGQFDKESAGHQMNVLGALISVMDPATIQPMLNNKTGTSVGDFNAGSDAVDPMSFAPITTGDKAGAGIVTAIIMAVALGAFAWMSID
ncbi:mannan endo-1,6-alpha-mannosidase DCW1 [Microdochium trichocladiopsis]|uniref:Mannan endo-1,6-alpha-mannosidase n=1 Tax=Microdochium trichocladiopsis TaxID=1682393 RepID=A0A9P9BP13_9PEZI|nr:mannan endo-1,6-alpha-mannosidase DCW1 [Microdochium trichocladiopsis]KAH7028782.1 mannan endo-1,6-alpha-mannosidase DCW1 [Microdochium trichocladiopsis]